MSLARSVINISSAVTNYPRIVKLLEVINETELQSCSSIVIASVTVQLAIVTKDRSSLSCQICEDSRENSKEFQTPIAKKNALCASPLIIGVHSYLEQFLLNNELEICM